MLLGSTNHRMNVGAPSPPPSIPFFVAVKCLLTKMYCPKICCLYHCQDFTGKNHPDLWKISPRYCVKPRSVQVMDPGILLPLPLPLLPASLLPPSLLLSLSFSSFPSFLPFPPPFFPFPLLSLPVPLLPSSPLPPSSSPSPSRMQSSEMGLLCAVAMMGAPAVLNEKMVTSFETTTALRQLEKTLASGVCEVDEGRSGNEQVSVTCRTLFTGEKVWVADEGGLRNIDIGPTANIPLVSNSKYQYSTCFLQPSLDVFLRNVASPGSFVRKLEGSTPLSRCWWLHTRDCLFWMSMAWGGHFQSYRCSVPLSTDSSPTQLQWQTIRERPSYVHMLTGQSSLRISSEQSVCGWGM